MPVAWILEWHDNCIIVRLSHNGSEYRLIMILMSVFNVRFLLSVINQIVAKVLCKVLQLARNMPSGNWEY